MLSHLLAVGLGRSNLGDYPGSGFRAFVPSCSRFRAFLFRVAGYGLRTFVFVEQSSPRIILFAFFGSLNNN